MGHINDMKGIIRRAVIIIIIIIIIIISDAVYVISVF
jgi:hypothetical protein